MWWMVLVVKVREFKKAEELELIDARTSSDVPVNSTLLSSFINIGRNAVSPDPRGFVVDITKQRVEVKSPHYFDFP